MSSAPRRGRRENDGEDEDENELVCFRFRVKRLEVWACDTFGPSSCIY